MVDPALHKKPQCKKGQQVNERAVALLWRWKAVSMPIPIHQIHVSGGFSLPLQQSRKKKMVACLAGCLFCLSLAFLSCLSRDGLQEHDPKWIRAIECLSKIRVYMNLSHLPSFPRGTLFCCFITVASVYFLLLFPRLYFAVLLSFSFLTVTSVVLLVVRRT